MFFCLIFNLNGQVSFTGQSTALSTTIPAGDDRLLLVQIVTTDGEANTSVSWGTNSLTLLRGALTPDDEQRLELWYYHAGSSTSDETASLTVANQASLSTSTFAGVNPTEPFVITPSPEALFSSGITQIFGGSTVGNLAYRATLVKTNVDVSQPAAQTEVCDILVTLDGSDHKNHASFKSVTTCPTDETGVSFGGNYSFVSMVARIQRIEADCNLTCGSNGTPNCDCTACDCDEGWSGPNCDICTVVCQNGGIVNDCSTATCNCTNFWGGQDCSECLLDCGPNGTPNADCTACICDPLYGGENCEECLYECNGNGTPNANCDGCDCVGGWDPESDCILCLVECQNGTLDSQNCECDCEGNWTGLDCSICNLACENEGALDEENCECICEGNWTGTACNTCDLVCENEGTLDTENCDCDCTGNWTGSDCSDCSLLCENGGSADVNCEVCSCTGGWFGPNCNLCAIFVGSECQLDLATAIAAALATDNPINIILDVTTEAVTQIPASVTIMVPEGVVWTHDSSLSNAGTVDNNGSVVILGSTVFTNTGTYKGTGTLEGQMINNGTIQIGQD